MAKPVRPSRAFIWLTLIILGSLGITAYLINFPVVMILIGELVVMLGLAWRMTRVKHAQPVTQSGPSNASSSQPKAESAPTV
jgi:hypothetical protein